MAETRDEATEEGTEATAPAVDGAESPGGATRTVDGGRRIRVGIDVGGTFTHAVAIDAANLDLVGTVKVPTTHSDKRGVAGGIVESLFKLLEKGKIGTDEIVLIAHSTTQATNALLEGDVAPVGIVGMAGGFGKRRARSQMFISDIELAPGRFLKTFYTFLDTSHGLDVTQVRGAVDDLLNRGAKVIVATAAFSVEDPQFENMVIEHCKSRNIKCTAACEISQLYGLRSRTRTAVINASMLPKMLETADMTEISVREAKINAPLMIMRSDGGIMDIDQMRKRPILTMLSGPAAGVAAAMMYARISDGIFLEVGGTSTDISAIRNGKSLVKSAVIGGHRLYVRTLDVRTLGVAGGSVPRVDGSKIVDAGPRSAHIANVGYSAFQTDDIRGAEAEQFQPMDGDPKDYVRMVLPNRKPFSVTPTCASNLLKLVPDGDPARGSEVKAAEAFAMLAKFMNRDDGEKVADEMLHVGTRQVVRTVEDMIEDYELDRQLLTLTGGGGGGSAIVPYTANSMGLPYEIAPNSAVISAIGAALALVRDTIERTVVNPTDADILRIRKEAEDAVVRMGAAPASIEVQIEIDAQRNILRASATGTTELRTRDLQKQSLTDAELEVRVMQSLRGDVHDVKRETRVGGLDVWTATTITKRFGGLLKKQNHQVRVLDGEGIIRLQIRNGAVESGTKRSITSGIKDFIDRHTVYGDAGKEFPDLFVLFRGRILDLSGLMNADQIMSLIQVELNTVSDDEPVAALLKV